MNYATKVILIPFLAGLSVFLIGLTLPEGALFLLPFLLFGGILSGYIVGRTGWLCGIISGLPASIMYLTHIAVRETGSLFALISGPDYWKILIPSCIVATGMSILGGGVGVWLSKLYGGRL